MAQFGLFNSEGGFRPLHTIEGDLIKVDGDQVQVIAKDPRDVERLVGVFRLEKGQCVKEIAAGKRAGV
jgi:hypothetical protein